MSWITKLVSGRFGPSQSLSDPGHWLFRGWGARTESGVSVNEFSALNLPVVYAAISRIADAIGMLPFHVYRVVNGRTELQPDHRVTRLLRDRPNPYMSAYTAKQCLVAHALGWGNGYWENELNGRGETIALWPLLPDVTYPERDRQDLASLFYRTQVNGKAFTLDPDQVVHIKALGHDGYIGYSPICLMRNAIGMAQAMETFGGKFFANEARSGGFIQHPLPLSPTAQKNLQGSVNAQGGLDNAHRIKVLEEGAKFIPVTVAPDDAQFLGSRSFQIAEIARMYNVPLAMLQEASGTSNWGAGIEQLMIAFVTYTLGPWITQLELEFDHKLFTESERAQGFFVKCNTRALLKGDMAAQSAWFKSMREMGVYTANEVRDLIDENRADGLDDYHRPSNWVPINSAVPGAATPVPPPADGDVALAEAVTRLASVAGDSVTAASRMTEAVARMPPAQVTVQPHVTVEAARAPDVHVQVQAPKVPVPDVVVNVEAPRAPDVHVTVQPPAADAAEAEAFRAIAERVAKVPKKRK